MLSGSQLNNGRVLNPDGTILRLSIVNLDPKLFIRVPKLKQHGSDLLSYIAWIIAGDDPVADELPQLPGSYSLHVLNYCETYDELSRCSSLSLASPFRLSHALRQTLDDDYDLQATDHMEMLDAKLSEVQDVPWMMLAIMVTAFLLALWTTMTCIIRWNEDMKTSAIEQCIVSIAALAVIRLLKLVVEMVERTGTELQTMTADLKLGLLVSKGHHFQTSCEMASYLMIGYAVLFHLSNNVL
ncbi:MAG: hypothetical protein M1816_008242 [Peltula sp. TS41687]|nr:MAG: hypothetical protein M1816_008242 [Peltula sp. TS41687]